jgi:phosphohistidine phosphatase
MMNLYLVQHGQADAKEGEVERSLTDRGIAALQRMTVFLDHYPLPPLDAIMHSGRLRARQTADILNPHIRSARGVLAVDDLEPNSDPKIWARKLRGISDDIMLVGHMPHLSRLTSLLLAGDPETSVVQFHNAGIVCLERDIDLVWRLDWVVIPRIML